MHKYIIMGVQGCGKGTQAKMLKDTFDLTHISVGDILRWNLQAHTKLAARIKRIMNEGQLVPDDIVEEIIRRRLEEHDWNYGFILDGFPRNRRQAEFFLEAYDIDAVILVEVPDRVVVERIQARRICDRCGVDYNLMQSGSTRDMINARLNTSVACAPEMPYRPSITKNGTPVTPSDRASFRSRLTSST